MKVLLVIFLIYINYVICADDKYAVRSFPKKVKPGSGNVVIHPGKVMSLEYIKPKHLKTTVKGDENNSGKYTVFQLVGNDNSKTVRGVPESPYFSVDQAIDQKPRVKKVLPEYAWESSLAKRQKRSPIEEDAQTESTPESKIENNTNVTTTTEKTTVKDEADTKADAVNDKVQFRSSDNNISTPAEAITENAKLESKSETTPAAKNATEAHKDNKSENVTKSTGTTKGTKKGVIPNNLRKGKNKTISRNNSKKSKARKGARAKGRKGKAVSRNGTALNKAKGKRQGRSKPKSKPKKNQHLRQPKSGSAAKKSKAKAKSAKKVAVRKGNSTNIKNPKETRRLTAARQVLIEDYPYVVSIQKDSEHWCSGALLNPRLVITTANCLWKANTISRMKVRAGSSFTDHGGQLANIQEVNKHPRWGIRKNPDNDVALVLLDRNIKFSHSVHGVDLPNRVMMPAFEDAWITSWGAERRDGIFDEQETALQAYHSYLMSNESCNNITRRFGISVTENFICFSQHGKTAPCTRDTGAPAVSDGVLWGLASWGIRKLCGTERFPAMFSYTASHSNMDFIANATTYMMSDERHYPFVDRFPPEKISKKKSPRHE